MRFRSAKIVGVAVTALSLSLGGTTIAATPSGPSIADVRPLVSSGANGLSIGDTGVVDESVGVNRGLLGTVPIYIVDSHRGLAIGSNCESMHALSSGVPDKARCFITTSTLRVAASFASGDDEFDAQAAITEPVSLTMGPGDDTALTRNGADTVSLGAGEDALSTGPGPDTITSGTGDDTVAAGGEDDSLDGGGDDDTLQGGAGADILRGGDGNDLIDAKTGEATANTDQLIDCGAGIDDKADVDLTDPIATACETVARSAIGEGPNIVLARRAPPQLRRGALSVAVSCPRRLGHPCAGTIAAATSEALLDVAPLGQYSIAAGERGTLRVDPGAGVKRGHRVFLRSLEPGDVRGIKTTRRRIRVARG